MEEIPKDFFMHELNKLDELIDSKRDESVTPEIEEKKESSADNDEIGNQSTKGTLADTKTTSNVIKAQLVVKKEGKTLKYFKILMIDSNYDEELEKDEGKIFYI